MGHVLKMQVQKMEPSQDSHALRMEIGQKVVVMGVCVTDIFFLSSDGHSCEGMLSVLCLPVYPCLCISSSVLRQSVCQINESEGGKSSFTQFCSL